MMEFNKQNEFVYEIHYDISLACNNRCDYCFQLPYLDNSKLFNEEVFENVIKGINQFKEQNPEYKLEIFIKGGEPLLLIDKVTEFIERVYTENVTNIHIYTNLNFKANGSKISKIIDIHNRIPFNLIVSVHDASNIDWIKENIQLIKSTSTGKHFVDIISRDSNIDFAIEFAEWMLDNYGPYSYSISNVVISGVSMLDYTSPRISHILEHQFVLTDEVIIDDRLYTTKEVIDLDFKNISKQYVTLCKINAASIRYDGEIKTLCQHPWASDISKGIEIQKVFCNNYTCSCNCRSYKQLMKEKANATV